MKRACVIGWPVEHSRSPLIHNYWLKKYGIDGAYTKEAVPPEAEISNRSTQTGSSAATSPCRKEAALAAADEKDSSALAVSAANTLFAGGKLHAANTDTYGYMTNLGLAAPGWEARDAPIAVLGAGGAARAIVYGFLNAGVGEVRVFNRTRARAEALGK
jgi:shikimate dehydrogenase